MNRTDKGYTGLLLAALAAVLLFGCTAFKQKTVTPPPPHEATRPATTPKAKQAPKVTAEKNMSIAHFRNRQYFVHEVRWPNESLVLIARWYTGSQANWKAIAKATPNLRNNRLHQGNVVFIPIDLLQIETPMPKQYVQQKRPPSAAPADRSSGDYQPQPYGPRPYPKKATP